VRRFDEIVHFFSSSKSPVINVATEFSKQAVRQPPYLACVAFQESTARRDRDVSECNLPAISRPMTPQINLPRFEKLLGHMTVRNISRSSTGESKVRKRQVIDVGSLYYAQVTTRMGMQLLQRDPNQFTTSHNKTYAKFFKSRASCCSQCSTRGSLRLHKS
jgi:hypothetical protein